MIYDACSWSKTSQNLGNSPEKRSHIRETAEPLIAFDQQEPVIISDWILKLHIISELIITMVIMVIIWLSQIMVIMVIISDCNNEIITGIEIITDNHHIFYQLLAQTGITISAHHDDEIPSDKLT